MSQLGKLKKTKILILANNDVGLYNFRKELIEELVKEYDVYISLPNGRLIPNLTELGCKFIETPISRRGTNPFTDVKLLLNYLKILKEVNPSIVLTYTIKPNIYGGIACRIRRIPFITNVTGLGTAVENKGILQSVTLFLYKISLKQSKCVFFQNQENKDFITNRIKISNSKLIPGSGVNLEEFFQMDYPSEKVINFLFIARIMKEKGIEQYLTAAEYIKKRYKNTEFHVLGFCEQNYESKLEEMEKKGVIIYHGMQSDIKQYYETSHCTIHPTFYPEGMSNVLLESASCARPIITTNRSGCREIVEDGVNGYLIEQKSSNDLIVKIERFLDLDYSEKKEMGLASRIKVKKEFDRRIVVDAYLKEIKGDVSSE